MEISGVTWPSYGGLPSGFRFDPSDKEVLVDYLFNKVQGNPLPSPTAVIDCDVYGEGRAWKRLFEESQEHTLYFFTRLKKKTENGKRVDRVTDCGTWRSQGDKKIYCYNGDNQRVQIGSKRSFSFIPKKGVQEMRGKWVMHEYRLEGCCLHQTNNNDTWCYVLCRIINKESKRRRNARDDEDDHHHEHAAAVPPQYVAPIDHVDHHHAAAVPPQYIAPIDHVDRHEAVRQGDLQTQNSWEWDEALMSAVMSALDGDD